MSYLTMHVERTLKNLQVPEEFLMYRQHILWQVLQPGEWPAILERKQDYLIFLQ